MDNLTRTQLSILECIRDYIDRNGYPPSVRDICSAVGLSSPSTVHSHLSTLERLGYICRDGGRNRSIRLTEEPAPSGVPILGTVAAGYPILAVEDAIGYIPYDPERSGEYFALKIKGESMINAGILDGDMIIVRRQNTALNGEIVVALIGDEATCKRLSLSAGRVMLLPENEEYSPIDGSEASILGKVTAVIRKY
ncbi:MAG: transcriptional repressor LexA [Clostridiales bacterium]|nr:transcriptional repressor LexA [Clostridiales bacterium]